MATIEKQKKSTKPSETKQNKHICGWDRLSSYYCYYLDLLFNCPGNYRKNMIDSVRLQKEKQSKKMMSKRHKLVLCLEVLIYEWTIDVIIKKLSLDWDKLWFHYKRMLCGVDRWNNNNKNVHQLKWWRSGKHCRMLPKSN